MKRIVAIALAAAMALPLAPTIGLANSIAEVEGARAKDRAYRPLNRQDREMLRRHGGNDDYAPYYGYGGYDYDGYYSGPSIGIYVGPQYRSYGYYPY